MLKLTNPKDETILDTYKAYRNKLTHIKEQAKKLHYEKRISDSKHNSGQIWKTVNEIIMRKQKSRNPISSIKTKYDEVVSEPPHISNYLNNHFSEIGSSMAAKIPSSTSNPHVHLPSVLYSFFKTHNW